MNAREKGRRSALEIGSRAHYEDTRYYTATYKKRLDDVQFYVTIARRIGGPVLEYGVGNGRIALPMARHGLSVTGVDQSRPMLRDFRDRLRAEPVDVQNRVTLKQGDMRRIALKKRFRLVVCPFNTALHLYARQDVERFLARVRSHLVPGGLFVVDLSISAFEDLLRDPSRSYHAPRFRHPSTGEIVRYKERFDYDPISQILHVEMEFEPLHHPERSWITPLAHRQFFPCEWEALLHYNGFEVKKVSGDFYGGPLVRTSDVMVWEARLRRGWST